MRRLVVVTTMVVLLAGCASTSDGSFTQPVADSTTASSSAYPSTSATDSTAPAAAGTTDSSGGPVVEADATLPDSATTPGAINPDVTQADIGQTICVSGWTTTVRPSSSVTGALKVEQLHSGYALNGDVSTSDYEEDHLISLELGGHPTDPNNLWPMPWTGKWNAHQKDRLENLLRTLICNGTIDLATAQHEISSDWVQSYRTRIGGK